MSPRVFQMGGGGPQRDPAVGVRVHGAHLREADAAQHRHLQHQRYGPRGGVGAAALERVGEAPRRLTSVGKCLICLAIGVTNQRETTLVWDKETGEPLYNAIGEAL